MMANHLLADADVRVIYELARVVQMDQWWHWLVLLTILLVAIALIVVIYRRDNVELPRGIGWLLITLRLMVVAALLMFFLDLQKRSEQRITKNSRAVLLIDTSQSMALRDELDGEGNKISRMEAIVPRMPEIVAGLQQHHDVTVFRFDEQERPGQIGSFPRTVSMVPSNASLAVDAGAPWIAGTLANASMVLVGLATALALVHLALRTGSLDEQRIVLYFASLLFLVALITFAVGDLRFRDAFWSELPLVNRGTFDNAASVAVAEPEIDADDDEPSETELDWEAALNPHGTRTRIGDALTAIVQRERGGPISGIAVFTDGNQNQGTSLADAVTAARDANIPIFPIGIGTDERPINVRIAELELPARVYPGDDFSVRVYLQATGLAGQSVRVELLKVDPADPDNPDALQRFDERIVRLGPDGDMTVVEFELKPSDPGRQTYVARVSSPVADSDPHDNVRRASVIVVDRKNRVLLVAGGPSRDYQFLRVQLFRDSEANVDVYLQGSPEGVAQDADNVLDAFPASLSELSQYDCIVAFDPDWNKLSDEQTAALDRWVAEQAGGLIVVAGPVYTPEWTTAVRERPGIRTIKALYPVSFYRRGTLFSRDRFSATAATPIELTPEGASSRFLWLTDDAATAMDGWEIFPGIYGNYPIRGLKPGATALITQAGDGATSDEASRAFLVTHFYGAGRVLFLGSGELWRLRGIDPTYFESLYTRLIRYVSEGRLLQDSERGLLLVDRDRCLIGDTVQVRAILRDEQFRPLMEPFVEVTLRSPLGLVEQLRLVPIRDSAREGTYVGQFVAKEDGDYQLHLALAGASGLDVLYRDVQSRMPDLETSAPQRNDVALTELAVTTHGEYVRPLPARHDDPFLSELLPPRDQETYIPGTPDRHFRVRLLRWLMTILCGCLCWEWLVRRWNRLA